MRKRRPHTLLFGLLFVALISSGVAPVQGAVLIAHYPLENDALDATGNNGPMTLVNAPFQDGGVYCNGIYPGGDPASCLIKTPEIAGLDPEWCSVSAEFMISEYASESYLPVFVCGADFRWMGVDYYPDGMIGIHHSNNQRIPSDTSITLDTWHKVLVAYDGTTETGTLFLDGEFVISGNFAPIHGNDRDFSTHNGNSARQFKGWFRNLMVYQGTIDPTPGKRQTWGSIKVLFR